MTHFRCRGDRVVMESGQLVSKLGPWSLTQPTSTLIQRITPSNTHTLVCQASGYHIQALTETYSLYI